MIERRRIGAASGVGLHLQRGQCLRVVDSEGGQSGDLVAYSADGRERLSNGRSFDYGGSLRLSAGAVLWSDLSRPMLSIVEDDVGRHDFLYAACSAPMYRMQYGAVGDHPNCHDNLCAGLRSLGLVPEPLPAPFNLFMNVEIEADGRLRVVPPRSRAGDAIVLRAEMDLAVALSACPASAANGGAPARALAYEVFDG